MKELAREISHQHERAREAKEVSGKKQNKNQKAAKVYPGECRSEVLRRQHGTKQPVKNHRAGDQEERNLKQRSRVLRVEQLAKQRNAQKVKGGSGATYVVKLKHEF